MKILKLAAAIALTLSSMFLANPAYAHDGVVSTSPGDKSTVDAGKFAVSITFEEDILDINEGKNLVIQIMAPKGNNASNNCLVVDGPTMSVDVDLDVAGRYAVAWQAVSSDGHSNTGSFSFEVKNDNNYKATGVPTCKPKHDTVTAAPPVAPGETGDGDGDSASSTQTPFFIGILVVLATLVGGVFYNRRRKGKTKDSDDAS
jgi:methionine-rich copper-binding protein CopC